MMQQTHNAFSLSMPELALIALALAVPAGIIILTVLVASGSGKAIKRVLGTLGVSALLIVPAMLVVGLVARGTSQTTRVVSMGTSQPGTATESPYVGRRQKQRISLQGKAVQANTESVPDQPQTSTGEVHFVPQNETAEIRAGKARVIIGQTGTQVVVAPKAALTPATAEAPATAVAAAPDAEGAPAAAPALPPTPPALPNSTLPALAKPAAPAAEVAKDAATRPSVNVAIEGSVDGNAMEQAIEQAIEGAIAAAEAAAAHADAATAYADAATAHADAMAGHNSRPEVQTAVPNILHVQEITDHKPEWADDQPLDRQHGPLYKLSSKRYTTIAEAEAEITQMAQQKAIEYFREHIANFPAQPIPVSLLRDFAIEEFVGEEFERSFGKDATGNEIQARMFRAHLLLDLERHPDLEHKVRQAWKQRTVDEKLAAIGSTFGLTTAILAAVAGYFRLNEMTSGQYRTRLKLAAVALIAAAGMGLMAIA
ncbi:MAG: hypothetical protein JSS02_13760 [Planctomycetes bacterium]|nr:hypothetical protein [Planctomycetota bacterium]